MINIIVAIGVNNLIGKNNDLPWHYKEDLQYFKEVTMNKTVIMGEQTFYSIVNRIGKPLPKRKSIVATFDLDFKYDGVEVTHDLIRFLELNKESQEEIFVIGGMQIYKVSLPYANKLYITHVLKEYEGNVYFPEINYSLYDKDIVRKSDELEFCVYTRKKAVKQEVNK